ncbi:MAG: lipoyl synthase [bacterium]
MNTKTTNDQRRLPVWLRKKINWQDTKAVKNILRDLSLNTVCEGAHCPNISGCFARYRATFMILGAICTRGCKFCAVSKGTPLAVDQDEPQRVARAVQALKLKHVVVTSVTRDDLADYGADHFARTIRHLKALNKVKIEVLTPDFQGKEEFVKKVVEAKPDVFNHNLETVPRLYAMVRPEASYTRSIKLLKMVKELDSSIYTKSGLMLGLGENESEVIKVMRDLREVKCDMLTLGQYLQPSLHHYPVKEYLPPVQFEQFKTIAGDLGFMSVASGPYVRSSYMAEENYLSVLS